MASKSTVSTVNAASADARVESEDPSQLVNAENNNKAEPPAKRARYNKPTAGKRHGGAFHAKEKPTTSLSIIPRKQHFPIFVSNLGCRDLASDCYQTIVAKDYRLGHAITLPQLQYVLSISFINRIVQCANTYGYSFPSEASKLKQYATGIQLPSVLANYIESIGRFTLSSGASVVPYVDDYRPLFQDVDATVDPRVFLTEQAIATLPPDQVWPLHAETIVTYNDATTRASRSGMNFRSVNNNDLSGKAEMLVSYVTIGTDMLLPKAPQVMSEAEAQLGVCYRFRDYAGIELWPGVHRELLFDAFTAIPCVPRVVFSDVCVAAFKGARVSTE